jgi:hypothetical protein
MSEEGKRPMKRKQDGRRNNGAIKGISRGQGRPRKTANMDIGGMTLNAMKKAFGSEEKAWIEVAKLAKEGSVQHWKWLLEYRYGRPKEQQEVKIDTKVNIPVIDFSKPKTIDITPEEIKEDESKEQDNK